WRITHRGAAGGVMCDSVRSRRWPDPGGASPEVPRRDDQPPSSWRAHETRRAVMAETWSGEFYCVKCKEKREAEGEVRVNDKGTKMAKAVCPVCSTNLNRILGKA